MPRTLALVFLGSVLLPSLVSGGISGRLDTVLEWHDNVTNAERPEDLLPALLWRSEVDTGLARTPFPGQRVDFRAAMRLESWPRFEGLDFAAPAVLASWEYKPGLGPHRPVLLAEGEAEYRVARESERGGLGGAVRLSFRQRIGAAWQLFAGHEWRRFDAQGRAFDRTGREWSGRLEWALSDHWLLAAEVRRRFGDVVSYSRPPRLDLEAIGKPITYVHTFEQAEPWIAYYFAARTRSTSVELGRMFDRGSLVLRHETRDTLHAGPGYKNRITALRYVFDF